MKEISVTEGIRLEQIEQQISELAITYRQSREHIGNCLLWLRDHELYEERGYASFWAYLEAKAISLWGLQPKECSTLTRDAQAIQRMREVTQASSSADERPLPTMQNARVLRRIFNEPEDMIAAWEHHQDSERQTGRDREGLHESIAEYKGEPTVRDVLKPEDMADLPSGEFDQFENWASETSKLVGPLHRMSPDEVADACERLYPEKIERHIQWADEIAHWYEAYRDELVARQRQGIHAVK